MRRPCERCRSARRACSILRSTLSPETIFPNTQYCRERGRGAVRAQASARALACAEGLRAPFCPGAARRPAGWRRSWWRCWGRRICRTRRGCSPAAAVKRAHRARHRRRGTPTHRPMDRMPRVCLTSLNSPGTVLTPSRRCAAKGEARSAGESHRLAWQRKRARARLKLRQRRAAPSHDVRHLRRAPGRAERVSAKPKPNKPWRRHRAARSPAPQSPYPRGRSGSC